MIINISNNLFLSIKIFCQVVVLAVSISGIIITLFSKKTILSYKREKMRKFLICSFVISCAGWLILLVNTLSRLN